MAQRIMDLATLIAAHGYWVLAAGALLEGETVLVLAGFAAHRGYLDPAAVVAIGSVAGWTGNQILFWIGRRHGGTVLRAFPAVARQAGRVHRLVERFPSLSVIGVRFAYGLRLAGPVLIGSSAVSGLRFAVLNGVGAVIWAILGTAAGWTFGHAAEALLGRIGQFEGWLLLGLSLTVVAVWVVRRLRRRHDSR